MALRYTCNTGLFIMVGRQRLPLLSRLAARLQPQNVIGPSALQSREEQTGTQDGRVARVPSQVLAAPSGWG